MFFISYITILAVALVSVVAGFIWWVPVIGTLALWATSPVWRYAGPLHERGILFTAGPAIVYLESFGHAALAQGASCILGLVIARVWF